MNEIEKLLKEKDKIFNEKQELLGELLWLKEDIKEKLNKYDPSTYEYTEKSKGKAEAYATILDMLEKFEKL